MRPRRLILPLSTIFKVRGGIPRFNQMLCTALDELSEPLGLEVTVLSQDDDADDYRRHGPPWQHVRFIPGGGQRRLVLRTLRECVRRRQDLMLVGILGMTPLGVMCRPLLRRGFGFVAHGIDAWDEPRVSRRIASRQASFAIAVSADTAQALSRSVGVRPEVIRVLPNTLARNFTCAPVADGAEQPMLLTVTRLWAEETRKGVDHALQAFARIAPRYPELVYRIVGKGSDLPRLVDLAASLGVADRVHFQQDLADEELSKLYQRCRIFVLPSGQEGFGIVFLEAMCYAKPCIGGAAGGTPEVVEDGRTGVLVPFGDVTALEAALTRLLDDAVLRRQMGEAGRARLFERFTFDQFRARVSSHLRELLQLDSGP